MAEVWRARHRLLKHDVAIKLIRSDYLATLPKTKLDDMMRRFEREARAMSGLQSPHTVTLFDYGRAQDGQF